MSKLAGKVALITGASGGLGNYISLLFAEEGAKLALCDINEERLNVTAKACADKGAPVLAKAFDISNLEQIQRFVLASAEQFGGIDILINLAIAIKPPHSFVNHEFETLDLGYRTGLVSTWNMMKECYSYLKKDGGKIVNFGSEAGVSGHEGYAAYAAIKEAIRGLSRVVAREWGPDNINVNVVNPGALTEGVKNYLNQLPQEQRDPSAVGFQKTAMRRYGDPYEDIAPVVLFLASEASRHITGQTLTVDGGVMLHA